MTRDKDMDKLIADMEEAARNEPDEMVRMATGVMTAVLATSLLADNMAPDDNSQHILMLLTVGAFVNHRMDNLMATIGVVYMMGRLDERLDERPSERSGERSGERFNKKAEQEANVLISEIEHIMQEKGFGSE